MREKKEHMEGMNFDVDKNYEPGNVRMAKQGMGSDPDEAEGSTAGISPKTRLTTWTTSEGQRCP